MVALGHEVHVVVCDPNNTPTRELHKLAASVTQIDSRKVSPWGLRGLAGRVYNPASLMLAYPNLHGLSDEVSRVLHEVEPDLVWAEEARTAVLVPHGYPIVHSHLDFLFKLNAVRRRSYAANRLHRPNVLSRQRVRDVEIDICRRAQHTMCASNSEARFLRSMGISASYVPVVGPTTAPPDYTRLSKGRLFLFGNPNTAMRAARHDLKTRIWPEVERLGLKLQWHQLGKKPRKGGDPSWEWLEQHFVMHGFVESLDDLFLPGDASVMPYPFDTGGRAKFAVSAGYGVVNIAYEKTFECAQEFTHGVDCLAARDPREFAEFLHEFVSDEALRLRLAEGSRAVYEKHFTMEAVYPKYERVLQIATGSTVEAVPCAS